MTDMYPAEKLSSNFGSYTTTTGILLLILGTAGIFLPGLVSLGTVFFIAGLLIIGGIIWSIHTYKYNAGNIMDWIKPALLFIVGSLMLFYPLSGVAAVGLLLAVYLFLDAFGSFALAQLIHPFSGWGWMVFNGMVSLLLALLFLIGWPTTSMWLVGLYISISLLFDGGALVAISMAMRKAGKFD
ncbi:hypothetical protein MNBD_GAMMA24-1186 [hydrothermal vent metagenome]|uniref:Acid-resistance membrane protein n=1 Tax=hydrothermal vent metagenome TaxID=652676 RepID=A0A3B1B8G0_9ZZZZ